MGYHVTVPCSKDDAGYRVFDAAFAVDRNDDTMSVVKIRYTHTMMRDQEAYHSRSAIFVFNFFLFFMSCPCQKEVCKGGMPLDWKHPC